MRRYKIVAINIIALIVLVYCNPLISSLIEIKSIAYTDGDIIPEKYDLRDDIDITVKNQYQNPICYMVASSSMWETNIKLRKKLYNDYKFYNISLLELFSSSLLACFGSLFKFSSDNNVLSKSSSSVPKAFFLTSSIVISLLLV